MKTIYQFALLVLLILCGVAVRAAIPGSMNYQGYLTDAGGAAVNASLSITFSIYTADTGGTELGMRGQFTYLSHLTWRPFLVTDK